MSLATMTFEVAPCDVCFKAKGCKTECDGFIAYTNDVKHENKTNLPPCLWCIKQPTCAVECMSFKTWERSGI
jgi:hypothetical protein